MFQTAIGRLVPTNELQTVLEDAILSLLFDFRMHPQNPDNVPMKLERIVHAVTSKDQLVLAALDALKEQSPPLVEEYPLKDGQRAFRITGTGVRFVQNVPQGTLGVLPPFFGRPA